MSRSHGAARRSAFRLEPLDSRDLPAFLTGAELIAAADDGAPPVVRLLDPATQAIQRQLLAFDTSFTGGVRVAVGDVNGDAHPDLILGAGRGGGPQVKVLDGKTGATLSNFFAYEPSFSGGVYVAAGDVDGDGRDEVITGSGVGGGPQVTIFDGTTGGSRGSGFAYDSAVRTGVRVAAGDTDGDGKDEIITGPGSGAGPDVRVFRFGPGAQQALQAPVGFFAYAPSFTGGVHVAAGDVDGDGRAEVITGAGAGGGPQVSVFTGDGRSLTAFNAYSSEFRGGVRVAAAELTGDKRAEIITGPGQGGGPQVNVYSLPSTAPVASLFGLPTDQTAGLFVAGSSQVLNVPGVSDFVINDAFAQAQATAQAERQQAEQAQQAAMAALAQAIQARQAATPVVVNVNQDYPYYSPFFYPYYSPFYSPYFGSGWNLGFGLGLRNFGLGLGAFGSGLGQGFFSVPTLVETDYVPVDYVGPAIVGDSGPVIFEDDPGYFDPTGYSLEGYGYDF